MIENREWLKEQWETKTAREIAAEVGITVRTVYNWLSRHGIPREGNENRLPSAFRDLSKKDLETDYNSIGVSGICSKYGVSRNAVYRAIDRSGIKTTKGIPPDSLDILQSPSELIPMYEELGSNGLANVLKVNKTTVLNYLNGHGFTERTFSDSYLEKSFIEFLGSLSIPFERRNRTMLDGLEIDVYLPEYGIGFELNGLYWHTDQFVEKNYHLNKTEAALSKGVRLYHIFEDEWYSRNSQWKSKVKCLVGKDDRGRVAARNTEAEVIGTCELREFFEVNHIQGFSGGMTGIRLVHKGQTVAAAIFKRDPSDSGRIVLNRYATSMRVNGGLGKILGYVRKTSLFPDFHTIVSYADRCVSSGNLYESTGWRLEGTLKPDYRYHYNNKRVRKQNFRRDKLKTVLGEEFREEESELQNTRRCGIRRIYDCGLLRYVKDLH